MPEPETVEKAFEEGKDNTENTDSDELIEPEEEPEAVSKEGENIALTEIPEQTEDSGFTVFTEENAEILTGESEEDQELIQDIENGEIIALSAALPGEFREAGSVEVISEGEDALAVAALSPSQYYLDSWTRVYCDEIWTAANDFLGSGNKTRMGCTYRSVHYIDDTGEEKVSPLYCLKATQDGLDSMTLKNEAVKALTNSVIQKLLYFGYGGPGDLGTGYDPSCSHIDWSKWQNRYVFTHIALSKVYFNDCGYATAAEVEHTGINRLIDKIQTLTIPARNKAAVMFRRRFLGSSIRKDDPVKCIPKQTCRFSLCSGQYEGRISDEYSYESNRWSKSRERDHHNKRSRRKMAAGLLDKCSGL